MNLISQNEFIKEALLSLSPHVYNSVRAIHVTEGNGYDRA